MRPFGGLPPSVVAHNVSSLVTTSTDGSQRFGNIVMQRKNMAGHTIIIEAMKTINVVMAS